MMIDSFLLPGDLPMELIYSFSVATTMAMIMMIMFFATRSRLAAWCTDAVTLLIAWAEAFIAYVAFRA